MNPVGRLEYAARYTHTFRDGRTIQVTNTHHETPGDRAWAVERVEEMVRAQQALGRPVDAHLVTRHAATEWVPERLSPAGVPDELVEVVLRQRGLAGLFADTDKIRAELAEILTTWNGLR